MLRANDYWPALLRAILSSIIEWFREQGRIEVRDQIKEKADDVKAEHDHIDRDDLSVDAAFDRLRNRATR